MTWGRCYDQGNYFAKKIGGFASKYIKFQTKKQLANKEHLGPIVAKIIVSTNYDL
jgi:hypothetical protein